MSLRAIYGHEALRNRLAGTIAASRFPQSALFVGPQGVGKQRVALWVAQGMLCAQSTGNPCGTCGPCREVLGIRHPDLHWYTPVGRLKATEPSKQVEEVHESIGAIMEDRRRDGLWGAPEGMSLHPLASIRAIQHVVIRTPFSATRKVIILGDAERLIVQESSQEAANALLKILEEPPADTTIILTTSEPQHLLPTIRSRLTTLRVPPVRDDEVRAFLTAEISPAPTGAELERRVLVAAGAIGRAVREDLGGANGERARAFVAAVTEGERAWLPLVLAQPAWSARGDFSALLDGLALEFRDRAVLAARAPEEARKAVAALKRIEDARSAAQGNVNPQLTLGVLASELAALV